MQTGGGTFTLAGPTDAFGTFTASGLAAKPCATRPRERVSVIARRLRSRPPRANDAQAKLGLGGLGSTLT